MLRNLVTEVAIGVGLLAGLLGAQQAGYFFGRRAAAKGGATGARQVGAVQGATLGLLGLRSASASPARPDGSSNAKT